MSKINDLLIVEAENHLSSIMADCETGNIIFHNFNHAIQVKKNTEIIGEHTGLSAEEMNILRICALFHDSGYVRSKENPGEESVAIASAFLRDRGIDAHSIDHVAEIIRSNINPQSPKDRIAEVLCDADMMYIATGNGIEQFDLLFDEAALLKTNSGKRSAFEKSCIEYFSSHTYFTEYGKTYLQPGKEAAIMRLAGRLERRKLIDGKKETPARKKIEYSRGVDTMFRVTARNQINLNSIADNKSNILISVNAIIISIIITMLAGNIGNMSKDIIPILVLLLICLVTIIIAILSTRPNIVTSKFSEDDLKNKNVDLTFFGNFIKLNYDDYLNFVKELMADDEHLYSTLLKNQYTLGKILSKKFRLVRIAYNIFMVGIIITVIVFLMNYLFVHN